MGYVHRGVSFCALIYCTSIAPPLLQMGTSMILHPALHLPWIPEVQGEKGDRVGWWKRSGMLYFARKIQPFQPTPCPAFPILCPRMPMNYAHLPPGPSINTIGPSQSCWWACHISGHLWQRPRSMRCHPVSQRALLFPQNY